MERQQILAEIRRCAAENDGQPLGRSRFEQETGIRESDWAGRYWTTWSEAVREAGFQPNEMVSRINDGELLGLLAALSRELGRFPKANDIRLAARQKPDFPSRNTFGRLGRKAEVAARLLGYCEARQGYEDVAMHCREVIDSAPPAPDDDDSGEADARLRPGVVYLVKMGRYHKIGRSNAVGRREYELSLVLPEEPNLVHAIETDDTEGIERYWHERFADRRIRGEWFSLSIADVRAFRRRKFM